MITNWSVSRLEQSLAIHLFYREIGCKFLINSYRLRHARPFHQVANLYMALLLLHRFILKVYCTKIKKIEKW